MEPTPESLFERHLASQSGGDIEDALAALSAWKRVPALDPRAGARVFPQLEATFDWAARRAPCHA